MQRLVVIALASLLLAPVGSVAQEAAFNHRANTSYVADRPSSLSPSREVTIREAARLVSLPGDSLQQQPASKRNWAGRHPVLVGMLVGAGAGAVIAAASLPEAHNPDVTPEMMAASGAVWGTGVGALGGWIVSLVRR